MSRPAPPLWRVIKEGDVNCPAMSDVTIGSPGPLSKAGLVCDLQSGHDSLHYDSQDHLWWRPGDQETTDEP